MKHKVLTQKEKIFYFKKNVEFGKKINIYYQGVWYTFINLKHPYRSTNECRLERFHSVFYINRNMHKKLNINLVQKFKYKNF